MLLDCAKGGEEGRELSTKNRVRENASAVPSLGNLACASE